MGESGRGGTNGTAEIRAQIGAHISGRGPRARASRPRNGVRTSGRRASRCRYRLARAILRDPSEAQDATHDALLQAWRKWPTLRDPSHFEQWFDRILVNFCRNRLRHASRWEGSDISGDIAMASGDPYGQADDRDVLGNAIATLSPDHRVVVALRYYRDLQVDDIATRLGIPAGTVQSRLHYALKQLHRVIDMADAKGTKR